MDDTKPITARYVGPDGSTLWEERYIFKNRYADGQGFIRESIDWIVIRSTLEDRGDDRLYTVFVRRGR